MGTEDEGEGLSAKEWEQISDLAKMRDEPLHPDLVPWVEENEHWGKMLRHPLVYEIPLMLPGAANRTYAHKQKALAEAVADEDWHTVVWLHERAYRLSALIEYVTGRNDEGDPCSSQGASRRVSRWKSSRPTSPRLMCSATSPGAVSRNCWSD